MTPHHERCSVQNTTAGTASAQLVTRRLTHAPLLHAQTNVIMKMAPGDCFTQRNVGNLVSVKDLNCMCCLEYAVDHLKVAHVLVCGHYNCGARACPLLLLCAR